MGYLEIQNLDLKAEHKAIPAKKHVKWRWLYKKMMQVLDWLSDYDDRMKERVVKRSVINSEDVSKLCMDSFYQVYEDTGKPPRLLIIGQDKWFELTGGDAFNWRGTAPIDIVIRDNGYDGRFNGIPVQVVPYINGAFCLPDIK